MKNTIELLNEVKAKYGLKSNYALARKLGQTDTDVARWMKGKNTLGDAAALNVADLLELDPAYVVACVHAEREKSDALKKVWERIATLSIGVVAGFLLVSCVSLIMSAPEKPLESFEAAGLMVLSSFNTSIHYANL
ncbi:MAG TPA: DUF3693 domain-containing protein [Sideroxyarcus sp.]|nr:DUF3693 domain-containing protein [Sideroxyarcus sp.]